MESCNSNAPAVMFAGVFALMAFFFAMLMMVVMVWVYCRIFSKAGYSWALGLLMIVPIANLIMPFILAFGDWPIQRELRQLRRQQGGPLH
jgi:hypothetical protein